MKRAVLFNSPINSESAGRFVDEVLDILGDDDELWLFMHSPGGNVSQALCLAQFLENLPHPITTCNLSGVDSAAIVLFAAGDVRLAAPQSSFFFHEASLEIHEKVTLGGLRRYMAELESDVNNITSYLEARTGSPASLWRSLMLQNSLLDAKQALKNGLLTKAGFPHKLYTEYCTAIFESLPRDKQGHLHPSCQEMP